MILLATFSNEIEAQLVESQLKESGIEYRTEDVPGGDTVRILVFEDDLEEAKEIMSAREMDTDTFMPDLDDDIALDDFEEE